MVKVTERRTKLDWACFIEKIAARYEYAKRITLVMDNLNIHNAGSLYEKFLPDKAKALWDRFEFVHTPKHGSWSLALQLNPAPSRANQTPLDVVPSKALPEA